MKDEVSWQEAVRRLKAAGYDRIAAWLHDWRNKDGTKGGWDGSIRRRFPGSVPVIWP